MIIEAYGIRLERLSLKTIELVRYWRNRPEISRYMEFREYISPAMQLKWFNSINTIRNNFFIIYDGKKAIGLISGAEIDWEKGITANGGIFIWDKSYYDSEVPARASVLLTDISLWLGMKKTYIKILNDNTRSINFNKSLGYELCSGQEGKYNQEYVLTSEKYFVCVSKIRQSIGAEGIIEVMVKKSEKDVFDMVTQIYNDAKTNKKMLKVITID